MVPWGIAGIAVIGLLGLLAGQRFAATRTPPVAPDVQGASGDPGSAMPPRAPDISSLTPRERADRLFQRVMRLDSEQKTDSVQLFAPMALAAYQMIDTLDLDLRYDYGRVAQVSGNLAIAQAQADTILAQQSTHLLGLLLASQAAAARGDTAARRRFDQRLLAAEPAETRKNLPEYERHRPEIMNAIAEAKRQ